MTIAAIANRQAKKSMTGIRSTASLTTTNVDPHTAVTPTSSTVATAAVDSLRARTGHRSFA
jgi:hypothetical protein